MSTTKAPTTTASLVTATTTSSSVSTIGPNKNLNNINTTAAPTAYSKLVSENYLEGAVAATEKATMLVKAAAITTVPQTATTMMTSSKVTTLNDVQLPVSVGSSSLLSSTSALAKFNRIIDNTMQETNYYSRNSKSDHHQPESGIHKQHLEYNDSRSNTSDNKYSNRSSSNPMQHQQLSSKSVCVLKNNPKKEINSTTNYYNYYDRNCSSSYNTSIDNQMKRNDVHYLLKQLNSFSDIEEVEIIDMNLRSSSATTYQSSSSYQYSTISTELGSPTSSTSSTPSHKIRHSSLKENCSYTMPQSDDYMFQSSDYLESKCFSKTVTAAIAGSSSHEFRASTSTGSMLATMSSNQSSKSSHSSTTGNVATAITVSPTIITDRSIVNTDSRGYTVPQNNAASAPTSEYFISNEAATSPPVTLYCARSRLVGDINSSSSKVVIKTELSSSSTLSSVKNPSSANSSLGDERRKPFFKCCYTPLDRWREKRNAAAAATANVAFGINGNGSSSKVSSKIVNKSGVGDQV